MPDNVWVEFRAIKGATPIASRAMPIDRIAVVAGFCTLPEEAWQFLVAQFMQLSREAGGFKPESRLALESLGLLGSAYFRNYT